MEETIDAEARRGVMRARAEAVLRGGGATLLMFWATLAVGFWGDAAPYESAAWPSPPQAFVLFLVVGVAGGLAATAELSVAAPVIGYAAAIAIQLFVLTGQASWQPTVVADVAGAAEWRAGIAGALGLALLGIVAGSLLASPIAARLTDATRPRPPVVRSVVVVVGAVALVAVLVADASLSPYLVPADEPRLAIGIRDGRVGVDPATVRAGRVTIVAPGMPDPSAEVLITYDLTAEQLEELDRGRLTAPTVAAAVDGHRLEMTSGIHAVVAVDRDWTPDPASAGRRPVLDAATFEVVAADGATLPVRGEGGAVQVAGFLVALGIHALAVAGVIGGTYVERRLARTPPADPDVGGAIIIAGVVVVVATFVVGGLTLLAIDLAHDPF